MSLLIGFSIFAGAVFATFIGWCAWHISRCEACKRPWREMWREAVEREENKCR